MLPALVFWLFFTGSFWYFSWHSGPEALRRWAKEDGYRIVNHERRTYRRGPFRWRSSGYQIVYRIEVQDRHGTMKSGWVRIGRYWWPDPNPIDMSWDKPALPPR